MQSSISAMFPVMQALAAMNPQTGQFLQNTANPMVQQQAPQQQGGMGPMAQRPPNQLMQNAQALTQQAQQQTGGYVPQYPLQNAMSKQAEAAANYAPTQSQRFGYGIMGLGEAIYDMKREKNQRPGMLKANENLRTQSGLYAQAQQDQADQAEQQEQFEIYTNVRDTAFKLTGDQEQSDDLGRLATSNPELAKEQLKQLAELKYDPDPTLIRELEQVGFEKGTPEFQKAYMGIKTDSDAGSVEKNWTFMESMPPGPDKEAMKKFLLSQKESIIRNPLPTGMRYANPNQPELGYEAIPGSNEDLQRKKSALETETAKQEQNLAMLEQMYNSQNTMDTAHRALDKVGWLSTGFFGDKIKDIAGTPAADLGNLTSTLKANVAFKALFDMRQASKTGGALGNVSNQEIKLLHDSWAALDQNQSPTQMRNNIISVANKYERALYSLENDALLRTMNTDDARALIDDHMEKSTSDRLMQQVPPSAVEYLRKNPDSEREFEKKYGFKPVVGGL